MRYASLIASENPGLGAPMYPINNPTKPIRLKVAPPILKGNFFIEVSNSLKSLV